ncbi:MAG: DNA primase [Bacteroidales bacterium]|nr:DNA primase [Bacteroidales bacterium]
MIKSEDISKILDAARIEDVVGVFVPLKKRGSNFIGLCPFHDEKTPSFNVNPARGIFKCFGCGEGGDSVAFLMKHQHYTYPEALRWLAERYHIHIEETEVTAEEKQAQSEKDRLFHVNEFAQKYFQDLLFNDEEGKSIGLSYFEERCLSRETIRKWGLGYCKDSWDDFCNAAKKEGYTEEELVKAGVAIRNENTGSIYDRFRARVTFPIFNIGGRVLGFSARILSSDKSKAKYVNSPESIIYSKSNVLFGLHLAKDRIIKEDLCYLVEGNMDAVMLHQSGVFNVVATSGTALTTQQINLIKRYTRNVTVLYDGDSAGIKATFKAVNLFLEQGLNVRTVLFPDGEDPDSFARKRTSDEFKAFLVEQSQNFIIYKTNFLKQQAADDPVKKAQMLQDIVYTISLVPDLLERSTYLQQCSSILEFDEATLSNALKKQLHQNALNKAKQETAKSDIVVEKSIIDVPIPTQKQIIQGDNNSDYEQEKGVIKLLLAHGERYTRQEVYDESGSLEYQEVLVSLFIVCDIVNDGIKFNDKVFAKIFKLFKESICDREELPYMNDFIANEDTEIKNLTAEILVGDRELSPLWIEKNIPVASLEDDEVFDKYVIETLLRFKLQKINATIRDIKEQLKEIKDPQESSILLYEYKKITDRRNFISKKLNQVCMN